MVEGDEESLLGALVVRLEPGLAQVAVVVAGAVVGDGLADAEGIEAHRHSAREEHGKPGDVGDDGLLILLAELQVTVLGEGEVDDKDDPCVLGGNVEPGEVGRDPHLPDVRKCLEGEVGASLINGGQKRADDEGPEHDGGHGEHHPVHADELDGAKVDGQPAVGPHELLDVLLILEVNDPLNMTLFRVDRDDGEPVRIVH
mmetsp:Transcript_46595/g.116730  ORF Transcript_46595/g.116730 Transcript_46595/m.116730 type:complete len:200 (+) Transcript_46595:2377-2976(+)